MAIEDFDRDRFEATVYAEGPYCFSIGNKVVAVMPAEINELIRFLQTSRGHQTVMADVGTKIKGLLKPGFCE